jgi:GR25 family glycosyltransferase involved in LPS biosynthesis
MDLNIIVLSLEKVPERVELMKKQLERLNLKAYYWRCFWGKDLTNDTFSLKINVKEGYQYRQGEPMNPGNLGTNLSHIGALSMAKALQLEYVIIMEDDIVLSDDFQKRIEHLLKVLPNDWEHVYLSGVPHITKLPLSEQGLLKTFLTVRPSVWTDCNYAYLVKNSAYEKYITKLSSLTTTTDDMTNKFIFEENGMISYTYFPFCVCAHTEVGSPNRNDEKVKNNHPSILYFKNKML